MSNPLASRVKNGLSSLYKVDSNVSLMPFRAYFTVSGEAPARIALNFGDEASDISDNKRETINNKRFVYDLQGRKVNSQFSILNSQLKKGLYIVNGKKVIAE